MTRRDYYLGFLSGFLSGLLTLPVLKTANIDLFSRIEFIVIPFFLIGMPAGLVIVKAISHRVAIIWQIGKFVLIGILNTLLDFGTLTLLILSFRKYINVEPTYNIISGITIYSFYKSTSFVAGVINSYCWNKYWTFAEPNFKTANTDFFQFLVASIIGLGINVGGSTYVFSYVKPISFNIDQWALIGAGFGTLLALTWNFVAYKFIVFKNQKLILCENVQCCGKLKHVKR
jgi:putative flippase GtrA